MDLYIKLYELGHPQYQQYRSLPSLFCSVSVNEAEKKVNMDIVILMSVVLDSTLLNILLFLSSSSSGARDRGYTTRMDRESCCTASAIHLAPLLLSP